MGTKIYIYMDLIYFSKKLKILESKTFNKIYQYFVVILHKGDYMYTFFAQVSGYKITS